MNKDHIEVAEMSHQFVYTPLYYAIHKNFFGHLETKNGTYKIQGTRNPKNKATDIEVFKCLANNTADFENVHFAIGDPKSLLELTAHDEKSPVLIGALVTGTAFWAVNHGKRTTAEVIDLRKFNKIVSYHKGSTSYDLAASIASESNKSITISEVGHPLELIYLQANKEEETDTIVLSPDILGILKTINPSNGLAIEFRIGSQYDYCDTLITAIATTRETTEKHPDLVIGFLKGLQCALMEVQIRSDGLINYITEREATNLRGLVIEALQECDKTRTFPYTVQINEALWMRLVTGPLRDKNIPLTDEKRKEALKTYQIIAAPYEHFSKTAIKELLDQRATSSRSPAAIVSEPKLITPIDLLGFTCAIICTAFSTWVFSINPHRGLLCVSLTFIFFTFGSWCVKKNRDAVMLTRISFWCGACLFVLASGIAPSKEFHTIIKIIDEFNWRQGLALLGVFGPGIALIRYPIKAWFGSKKSREINV